MTLEKLQENYNKAVLALMQQPDEIKLQIHMFNRDARNQWEITEKKWSKIRSTA